MLPTRSRPVDADERDAQPGHTQSGLFHATQVAAVEAEEGVEDEEERDQVGLPGYAGQKVGHQEDPGDFHDGDRSTAARQRHQPNEEANYEDGRRDAIEQRRQRLQRREEVVRIPLGGRGHGDRAVDHRGQILVGVLGHDGARRELREERGVVVRQIRDSRRRTSLQDRQRETGSHRQHRHAQCAPPATNDTPHDEEDRRDLHGRGDDQPCHRLRPPVDDSAHSEETQHEDEEVDLDQVEVVEDELSGEQHRDPQRECRRATIRCNLAGDVLSEPDRGRPQPHAHQVEERSGDAQGKECEKLKELRREGRVEQPALALGSAVQR